ncbi:zinc-binding dehydrogenase [Grimontia hollisae]|uniref:zinc-binding dehydrogenase n=1 Tax=Grimontia hollisae TaxID=673 RepID=UPI001303BFAC|nr:zinc-binding dehydrogenase [Grimontia hollisae]
MGSCGAYGLAALLTAQFYSPAKIIVIDLDENRLQVAKQFGATDVVNSSREDAVAAVMALTDQLGVDTSIEAVGIPATFAVCESIVTAGGNIANVGVHGTKVDLHLETLWAHNVSITTRLVDTQTTPMLLKTVASKKLDPSVLITHRFSLEEVLSAYDTFSDAAHSKALKVIISP